jgi:catechol 2,3-dioxygenase-like lactoylglutathione lyase family enzyme
LDKKEKGQITMDSSSMQTQLSLAGIAIRVEDVERSLAFYCKLPDAQVLVHRPGVMAMVRIGTARLGLIQASTIPVFHLEFETTSDLEALAQQFRDAGIEHVKKPTLKNWGEFDFTMRDPDGNLLEFEAATQAEA